jgi:antitoxin HicB
MATNALTEAGLDGLAYPARLVAEDDGFVVTFRDLPAVTEGDDREQALARAVDALETALNGCVYLGEDIPTPSKVRRGEVLVPVPTLGVAKLALYLAMRADGVSKSALARALGGDRHTVNRLLNLAHGSRLEQLDAALRHLGRRLAVRVDRAA